MRGARNSVPAAHTARHGSITHSVQDLRIDARSKRARGGGVYEGTIPAPACGDAPDFYFSYVDAVCGLIRFPEDAPATFLSMQVGAPQTILADDFDLRVTPVEVQGLFVELT